MTSEAPVFRPIPAALVKRIIRQARLLGAATTADEQIAALFLIHCECKDAADMIAQPVGLTTEDEV